MLKSELDDINELINSADLSGKMIVNLFYEVDEKIKKIRLVWNQACFSRHTEQSLKRYFEFHLQGILEILDSLQVFFSSEKAANCSDFYLHIQNELISLVNYLKSNFAKYLNLDIIAPACISKPLIGWFILRSEELEIKLRQASIATDLKNCLIVWLEQFRSEAIGKDFTLASLDYINRLLKEITNTLNFQYKNNITNLLIEKLTLANFNYLGFFNYLQISARSESAVKESANTIKFFQEMKFRLTMIPKPNVIYDKRWPDLTKMLSIWIDEEINFGKVLCKENNKKMQLLNKYKLFNNVSVAHLACLIQLFYKENYFGDISLTDIFKFASMHYRTKRQNNISQGSLSKEFYSINQITAARVKDQLQRMIIRINHDFFPVLVVATLMICFQSKS